MTAAVRLGLRTNLGQFGLLVLVNAFVGAMIGLERSILPAIAEEEFGLAARSAILSFIVAFGVTRAATALTRATAPEIGDPVILVELGAIRPTLAKVGPFTVEAASRGPLRAALAVALILIAALAGWIALRELRTRRAA